MQFHAPADVYVAPMNTMPGEPGWQHLGSVQEVQASRIVPQAMKAPPRPTRVTIEHEGPWEMTSTQMEELKGTAATMDVDYGDFEDIRSGYGDTFRHRVRTSEPVTRITNLSPAEAMKLLTTSFKGVGEAARKLGDAMRGGSITMKVQLDDTVSRGLFQMMTGGWGPPMKRVWKTDASELRGGRQHSADHGGRRGGRKIRAH